MFKYAYTFGLMKQLVKDIKTTGTTITRSADSAFAKATSEGHTSINIPKSSTLKSLGFSSVFPVLNHEFGHIQDYKARNVASLLQKSQKEHPFDFFGSHAKKVVEHPMGEIAGEFVANANAAKWLENKGAGKFIPKFEKDLRRNIQSYRKSRITEQLGNAMPTKTLDSIIEPHVSKLNQITDANQLGNTIWQVLKRNPESKKQIQIISKHDKLVQMSPFGPKSQTGSPILSNI